MTRTFYDFNSLKTSFDFQFLTTPPWKPSLLRDDTRWKPPARSAAPGKLFKHTFCCHSWVRKGTHQCVSPSIAYFMAAVGRTFSSIVLQLRFPINFKQSHSHLTFNSVWSLWIFECCACYVVSENWWCTKMWSIKGLKGRKLMVFLFTHHFIKIVAPFQRISRLISLTRTGVAICTLLSLL